MALRFVRLSRLTIRKLKPGEKVMEHGITFDSILKFLGLDNRVR